MASGKITIANNTAQVLQYRVWGPTSGGVPVASGAVQPNVPLGIAVSGYDLYMAQFQPMGSGQIYVSTVVGLDSHVEFIVSSDSPASND